MISENVKIENTVWGRVFRLIGTCAFLCFSLLAIHFSLSTAASAQDDPPDQAPPPLKLISKDELTLLAAKTDIKDRTKLSVELMNARLLTAEKLTAAEDYEGMFRELGAFVGLMDDAVTFLNKRDNGSGKVLDNYKRMEISLRGMAPRIEVIRRELPPKYDEYVKKLTAYIREVRAKAADLQFGDSVLPGKKPGL